MRSARILFVFGLIALLVTPGTVHSDPAKKAIAPLKALLITGGGYHDYAKQQHILSKGISARANVEWTIKLENPKSGIPEVYSDPDWAKKYDVIVHNECHAKFKDPAVIEKIVKAHLDNGVGVVMIHCAMHTFRDTSTKEWDKLVGVESRRHGRHFPIKIENKNPTHPVMKGFPESWMTPKGELYHTKPLKETTVLGVGSSGKNPKEKKQVCIWTSTHGKSRTFGTTIGHYNVTMEHKNYLDLVTRGLLWSCNKLGDDGKPVKGYGAPAK